MVTASFLIVILFLGGWHLWGVTGSGNEVTWLGAVARVLVLMAKVLLVILFFMMVRWSWPRFRFDQLMALAWKVMLPLGLVNLVAVAVLAEYGDRLQQAAGVPRWALLVGMWAVAIAAWLIAGLAAPLQTDNRPRWELDHSSL
jgi:NADH-quinone oxidoreductase subunit H